MHVPRWNMHIFASLVNVMIIAALIYQYYGRINLIIFFTFSWPQYTYLHVFYYINLSSRHNQWQVYGILLSCYSFPRDTFLNLNDNETYDTQQLIVWIYFQSCSVSVLDLTSHFQYHFGCTLNCWILGFVNPSWFSFNVIECAGIQCTWLHYFGCPCWMQMSGTWLHFQLGWIQTPQVLIHFLSIQVETNHVNQITFLKLNIVNYESIGPDCTWVSINKLCFVKGYSSLFVILW